jgi:hypothetical protein
MAALIFMLSFCSAEQISDRVKCIKERAFDTTACNSIFHLRFIDSYIGFSPLTFFLGADSRRFMGDFQSKMWGKGIFLKNRCLQESING